MKIFNNLLKKAILIFIAIAAVFSLLYGLFSSSKIDIIPIIIVLAILVLTVVFRKKLKPVPVFSYIEKLNVVEILVAAFILRLIWVILIPTSPCSDFAIIYNYAKEAANGQYYGFHGTSYFARFAHDSVTVLYFSLFYHITNNPLIIVKLFNVIFQTAAVYYMYKLVLEVFKKESSAKVSALLLAVFPPFIMYVSQTMSENMAMPLYIASVFYFFKGINQENKKSIFYFALCGVILSMANMFRMVGVVVLTAYAMYLILYEGYKIFLKRYPVIIAAFCVVFFIVSQSLLSAGIIENQLWNSKEPAITSVLKGTNIEFYGAYNDEDAKLPITLKYDKSAIKREASKIIVKRLTTTPPLVLAKFYVIKLARQWGCGDFEAADWTLSVNDNSFVTAFLKRNLLLADVLIALIYIAILIRAAIPLIKDRKGQAKEMYFFYILMAGFVLFYLITEMQPRYGFIAAWIFVVLGAKKVTED